MVMDVHMNKILSIQRAMMMVSIAISIMLFSPISAESYEGYIVYEKEIHGEICRLDVNSKEIKIMTENGSNAKAKHSPDQNTIAFLSRRGKHRRNFELYIMDIKGQHPKRLTFSKEKGEIEDLHWDATGTKLIFKTNGPYEDTGYKVITLKFDDDKQSGEIVNTVGIAAYMKEIGGKSEAWQNKTTKQRGVLKGNIDAWLGKDKFKKDMIIPSPDGRFYLFFFRMGNNISSMFDVFAGKEVVFEKEMAGEPAWSKDSSKIVYFAYDKSTDKHSVLRIYDVFEKKKSEYRVTKPKDFECGERPSWSRDAKAIAYTCGYSFGGDSVEDNKAFVYILDLETKGITKLTRGVRLDW